MDKIEIKRDVSGSPASIIFGTVTVNGVKKGVTLENFSKRIRNGTYNAQLYSSPRFGRQVILLDVPGRTYIEIHAGNSLKDTTGCILVGKTRVKKEIWHSSSTLNLILEAIETPKKIQVTVK